MNPYADLSDEQVNALIAERLFGRRPYEESRRFDNAIPPPSYASDHNASMGLVVPAMRGRGYWFELVDMADNATRATFGDHKRTVAVARANPGQEPRAICEAALLASDEETHEPSL